MGAPPARRSHPRSPAARPRRGSRRPRPDRRCGAVEILHRGADRAPGSVRGRLDRQLDAVGEQGLERPLGESTTITRSAPASRAARTGHNSIGMPHSSCRTFGVRECMRVPWPAARIRTVGAATVRTMVLEPPAEAGRRVDATGEPGLEPGLEEPKSPGLPLPHSPSAAAHPRRDGRGRRAAARAGRPPATGAGPRAAGGAGYGRRPWRRGTRPPSAPASEAGPPAEAIPSTRIAFSPRLSFSRPSLELTSSPHSSRTRSRR